MSAAALATYFPGTVQVTTYVDVVRLYLNVEAVRVRRIMDMVDAMRIANGSATVPPQWIDVLAATDSERSQWKTEEFRREG